MILVKRRRRKQIAIAIKILLALALIWLYLDRRNLRRICQASISTERQGPNTVLLSLRIENKQDTALANLKSSLKLPDGIEVVNLIDFQYNANSRSLSYHFTSFPAKGIETKNCTLKARSPGKFIIDGELASEKQSWPISPITIAFAKE